MYSAEEECVDLDPTLYPTGNVENWLLVVEHSMKNTGNLLYVFAVYSCAVNAAKGRFQQGFCLATFEILLF